MSKTRTTVRIAGRNLNLVGDDSSEYMHELEKYINEQVRTIKRNYPSADSTACLVLATLNITDELFKMRENYEQINTRLDKLRRMSKSDNDKK